MSKLSLGVQKAAADEPSSIIALGEARALIARARDEGDTATLKGLRNAAVRWEYQLRRRKDSRDLADDAGEIKVRAEQALAVFDVAAAPHGVKEEFRATGTLGPLADLHHDTRAEIRKLAPLGEERLARLIAQARDDELRGVTTAHVVTLMSGHPGGTKASVTNEWYTPARYVQAARAVMGGVDLDPASSALANETVGADEWWGIDSRDEHGQDSLSRRWHGRVWLNPPYGKGSGLFTSHLVAEFDAGHVEQAVLLLNAYGFDSDWFQPLWDYPICFTDHRVAFTSPHRKAGGPANGNIFIYLGPDAEGFAAVFREFGHVVRVWP